MTLSKNSQSRAIRAYRALYRGWISLARLYKLRGKGVGKRDSGAACECVGGFGEFGGRRVNPYEREWRVANV
jgi:hypothetical protein